MKVIKMKVNKKQQYSIDFYIKNKNAKHELIGNVNVLRYDVEVKGTIYPALALFVGRSSKARSNYRYQTKEQRETEINRVVTRESELIEEKKQKLEERKSFKPTAKQGDIFVCSWGYEQTQVDFYLVQEVKGKTGTFVAISSTTVEDSMDSSGTSDRVVADASVICGEPFKKRISKSGDSESIKMNSYSWGYKWSGCSKHRSWGY